VLGSLAPARSLGRVLTGRCIAGPSVDDAVEVASKLVAGGYRVALEHVPGPAEDAAAAFGVLLDALHDNGLVADCELTLPVDRLGIAASRALAADGGTAVVLAGPAGPVRSAVDGLGEVGIVVPAARPDAESLCRERAGGRVRLVAGRGGATDLAFVRCLDVLMAGSGRPALWASDPRLVAIAGERAAWYDRTPDSWEYVMSYGIRTEQQQRLLAAGHAVRVAVPSGPAAAVVLARRLVGRA
jgi:proline dehydrogenase